MFNLTEPMPALGRTARLFELGSDVSGVLWTPAQSDRPHPVVLFAHGGGQSAQSRAVTARALRLVDAGYLVLALDAPGHGGRTPAAEDNELRAAMRQAQGDSAAIAAVAVKINSSLARRAVPEWVSLLDSLDSAGLGADLTRIGFWGLSLGAAIGVRLVAADRRLRAAVVGLAGAELVPEAAKLTVPARFVMQWDDQLVPRQSALQLFDAIGAPDKDLHANPGRHQDVPDHENLSAIDFFDRQFAV